MTSSETRQRKVLRVAVLIFFPVALVVLCSSEGALSRGLSDVPLRNWGGFSINRHWTYDAVERLVVAGLADRVVFNTKPLDRMEMAKIVAQAIKRIRKDQFGEYENRRYLESTLYDLMEEFRPELRTLGIVSSPDGDRENDGFLIFKGLNTVEARFGASGERVLTENSQGDFFPDGPGGTFSALGRLEAGDHLAFLFHPELRAQEESDRSRLIEAYVKLSAFGLNLSVGRQSIWWGPGFHGSLVFSNNARPMDMVRISTDSFTPPWVFSYAGETKLTAVIAQLEDEREFPDAKILAYRIDFTPLPNLELGFSPALQFGGEGNPDIGIFDIPELMITVFNSSETRPDDKFGNTNALFAVDAAFRIPDIPLIGRSMQIYGEFGMDDVSTDFKTAFLGGIYVQTFLGRKGTDMRLEYAQTSDISFSHGGFTDGFSYKDRVISHFIGTDGRDLYMRATKVLGRDVLIGVESGYSEIGSTVAGNTDPNQKRFLWGFDLSYRMDEKISFFGRFRLQRFENFNFDEGNDEIVPTISLRASYSF